MNKKQIRLTESELKQMVKESVSKILSEAYGTMNAQDSADMARMENPERKRSLGNARLPYNSGKKPSPNIDKLMNFYEQLDEWADECGEIANIVAGIAGEEYADAVICPLYDSRKMLKRVIAKAKMNMGQQPNQKYDIKFPPYDSEYISDLIGGKTNDNIRRNASKHIGNQKDGHFYANKGD